MTSMPIRPVKMPTVIAAQPNGAVDPALLSRIDRDGYLWQFAALPARGMAAMRAAIHADLGITLSSTGRGRDLAGQWSIFGGSQARYRPCSLAEYNTNHALNQELTKRWPAADRHAVAALLHVTIPESDYWTKVTLPGGGHPATAAVPGTSPHGWWCADDLCLPGNQNLTAPVLQWLFTHELEYGFAHSTPTENWHVQWYVGDTVPAAVLAYEASLGGRPPQPENPPPTQEEDTMTFGILELSDSPAIFIGPTFKRPDGLYSLAILTWIEGTDEGLAGLAAQKAEIPNGGAVMVVQADGSKYSKSVLKGMWVNKLPAGFVVSDFAGVG